MLKKSASNSNYLIVGSDNTQERNLSADGQEVDSDLFKKLFCTCRKPEGNG